MRPWLTIAPRTVEDQKVIYIYRKDSCSMSWSARGDVIQRVNRIFTADDTVLAGGVAARILDLCCLLKMKSWKRPKIL